MEINKQIKDKVNQSTWRVGPYRNGGSANDTFGEIVNESFDQVKRTGRGANHCRLEEMYHPTLGNLRRAKTYTSLAPTYGMKYKDRRVDPDLRPFAPYKPKQGEWHVLKEKPLNHSIHSLHPLHIGEPIKIPYTPTIRRQYPVPADSTRFENFSRYWNGRAKGLEYSEPFLHYRTDNYDITEDRRYQRLFWSPVFIPSQPTARHARQVILTAYS